MTTTTDFNRAPSLPIAATIVWGLLLLPALGAAMMSPMMFDAPGSANDRALVLLFWCVAAFPIFCIASIVASWIAWSATRTIRGSRAALTLAVCALLPVVPVLCACAVALFHNKIS